jgi:hypothetical protein
MTFRLPDAAYVSAEVIASGPDGALVVAGYALSADSRIASYIAWISPDRKRQIVNRVWPFRPYVVSVAPDGTIWAVGPVKIGDTTDDQSSNVLRHYEPSGRLLATVDVKARGYNGLASVSDGSKLRTSSDRVGWLTHACEYIEFSFSAVEMGRYECPNGIQDSQMVGGIALSSEGDLLVGGRTGPPSPFELDRATKTWNPVSVPADILRRPYEVLGFDGSTLVTQSSGRLQRFTLGEAPAPSNGH